MEILETMAVRISCGRCSEIFDVPLSDVLLSHPMLHEGYPVRVEIECSPLTQSRLFTQGVLEALGAVWNSLEQEAHAVGGMIVFLQARGTKAA